MGIRVGRSSSRSILPAIVVNVVSGLRVVVVDVVVVVVVDAGTGLDSANGDEPNEEKKPLNGGGNLVSGLGWSKSLLTNANDSGRLGG